MKRQQFGFARCRERNTCSGPDAGPKPPNENKASEKLRAALTHGSVCVPLPGLGVGMAARGPRRRTKSLSCGSSELERERAAWWGSRWQRGASRGPSVDLRCCMLDPETCSARWDVRTYGVRAGFFVGPQTQRWETRTDANQSENAQPSRGPAVSFCVSTVRCLSKWEPSVWYGVCSTSVWITSWIVYLLHWWVAGFWQWNKMFFFGFFWFLFFGTRPSRSVWSMTRLTAFLAATFFVVLPRQTTPTCAPWERKIPRFICNLSVCGEDSEFARLFSWFPSEMTWLQILICFILTPS